MKQLKPRDKVTQHMTRDGLTLDNQTTGESINISSREAEQDYSAAEPGGTAEKVLERAGDIRERSKAKRAAKDGANTAAQATGPASRLQFTAEERADPALSKYVHKAEKRADKLDAAKPLPSIGVDELAGNVEQYEDFFKALEQTSPVPMAFEDIPGGSHGYYHLTEKRIAIQENMSELQTLKTAIHEIAHAKLHAIDPDAPVTKQADRPDSRTREVQAESVAYAVCQHYGLDTSDYNKVIWQCVTATKKGKKFCPDSKGIAEETIEQAFIESYRLLCQNNKDVLDEFIARTEETLSDSNASKQLAKVEKDIAALDAKRAKLVDMRLEEIIDKDTYEQKYFDLSSQIEQLQKQRESLQESAETDSTMKKRIAEFRRTLEENEVLDTFDRYVFESIVEKVIVGGYDEDGNKDPSMLTFIYKTGFKSSLDGTNFKPPRKNSKAAKQSAGLCSHTTDEAKSMCSYHSDDTRGVCGEADARIKEVEM